MTTTSSAPPFEYEEEARGANRLQLSSNGRWLAMEYTLSIEVPLVALFDRQQRQPVAVARGVLAGPPADDGSVFYLFYEGQDGQTRNLSPLQIATTHVKRLYPVQAEQDTIVTTLSGAYRGTAVPGIGRLVLLGGSHVPGEIVLLDSSTGKILATNPLCSGGWSQSPHVVQGDSVYVLCMTADPDGGPGRHTLVSHRLDDLQQRWRHDGVAPGLLFTRIHMAATADRVWLLSETSLSVPTFSARTGQPEVTLRMLSSQASYEVIPSARPQPDVLVMWTNLVRGSTDRRGWQVLRLHQNDVDVIARHDDDLPPTAAVHDGTRILLAPFAAPRSSNPDEWGNEVTRYLRRAPVP